MRDSLSVDRDANAIRLRRSTFVGAFLLVEGSTDQIFYERFADPPGCEIISYSGRSPSSKLWVIDVLDTLEKSEFLGVIAIVDADFDRLKSHSYNSPNLFWTDTHDLETMLLNTPALDKVVAEFGSAEKVAGFGKDIRTVLLEAGMQIGYLRWFSQVDKLNLTFSSIKFSKFIDEQTLKIDLTKLVEEVKNKSQKPNLQSSDLQQRIIKQSSIHDPWQVCCGHDLVEILSLGLRKAIGSNNPSDVEPSCLERSLRLAYEATYFCKTQLYLSIRSWEASNQKFKVLQ
jgi:Protein of unknown function (DUF4435)